MMSKFLCFVLIISMMILMIGVAAGNINEWVLEPCKRPGGPHPGCPNPKNKAPTPANPYNRGCSRIHRCRGG
ncbi:protein ralf-like 25 [Quercus suber]|uniref:Protein ralf-like 25 n=1 Tax=Quercus suber TaxID=58331 RepID=A0AAW0K0R8_QUESU